MKLLVTGGYGFIGSNFILYMLKKYGDIKIINLDLLTYAANKENLKDVESDNRHTFIHGDICDKNILKEIFNEHNFSAIINFAAESHVDRSIKNPHIFVHTNILGTQVLLDFALKTNTRFIQISTDEVYGTLSDNDPPFTENNAILPNSPYAASKASADMLVRAYHNTYGLNVNITRCSNNYGPRQHKEKLIPLMISNTLRDIKLPIYGDGKNIRDWLHVYDHCRAINEVLNNGKNGDVYNIGGNNEVENIDLVKTILRKMNKPDSLINYVEDRLGHDRRYAIDNTKITKELGFKPRYTFEEGLQYTINWYVGVWFIKHTPLFCRFCYRG